MKNGKLFSKISIIDILVILLVVVMLVAVAVRVGFFSSPDQAIEKVQSTETPTAKYTVKLRFQNITALTYEDPIQVGDAMLQSGKSFGAVKKVTRTPYQKLEALADGTTVTVDQLDAYNYTVETDVTLSQKNGTLRTAAGKMIAVGMTLEFSTQYFGGKAVIIGVEKIQ